MYKNYIAQENEVLVFFDVEIYNRELFYNSMKTYLESVINFEGQLIFDGSFSQIMIGDSRPRTILFIFKWRTVDLFQRWWNSSQNFRLKQNLADYSDLKVTMIVQNSYHDKLRLT